MLFAYLETLLREMAKGAGYILFLIMFVTAIVFLLVTILRFFTR